MQDQKFQMLEILQYNKGFIHPEKWIEYGISHKFKKTKAERIDECPDCTAQSYKFIGQFVYYSTLINLQKCTQCGLIFTDTRIDPSIISAHFEQAYKDEEYFLLRRYRIFQQIAGLVVSASPLGGRILDVGGAKGHLLATLNEHRPDLTFVLNDLSKDACQHAESKYGFKTILGGINELERISSQFDVIVLSDVIYYEPQLRKLWAILPRLVAPNGTIIIRVPNKLGLIRFWLFMNRVISEIRSKDNRLQDKIKFFNPEHLFVFSRSYLINRLKSIGFNQVFTTPSELLISGRSDLVHPFLYYLCKIFSIISFGRLIFTPSLLVIAKHNV